MTLPRLYPIVDTALLAQRNCDPVEAAAALLDAGARILQFRHKGHYSRAVFAQAERIGVLCRQRAASYVVNDRADIAMLLEAGLHVGQNDLYPADARRLIGPHRMLGYSTHNESQLRDALAEPVDYLAIGPIFTTGSKQNPDPVVGVDELRRLRPLVHQPLVSIGGITLENAPLVYKAGADSIAVIGALFAEPCTPDSIRRQAALWLVL